MGNNLEKAMTGPIAMAIYFVFGWIAVYFFVGFLVIKAWSRARVYRGKRSREFDLLIPSMHFFWPFACLVGFLCWVSDTYSDSVFGFIREFDNKCNSLYDRAIHAIFGKPE